MTDVYARSNPGHPDYQPPPLPPEGSAERRALARGWHGRAPRERIPLVRVRSGFAPLLRGRSAARARSSSAPASATRNVRPPALRTGPPRHTVRLGMRVREVIRDEISAAYRRFAEQVEVGGWLLGPIGGDPLEVALASEPGRGARHGPASFDLDPGLARDLEAAYPGFEICGGWHTHPLSDDGRPSDDDLIGWRTRVERLSREPGVNLIVTRGEGGWLEPTIHVWLTHRDGRGCWIHEPAKLDGIW